MADDAATAPATTSVHDASLFDVVERGGDVGLVDHLVTVKHASPNARKGGFPFQITALMEAAQRGLTHHVDTLLRLGADPFLRVASDTVVQFAAVAPTPGPLAVLVAHGVPLTVSGRFGCTALGIAARCGNMDVVEFLLQHPSVACEAHVGKTLWMGMTAADEAANGGHTEVHARLVRALREARRWERRVCTARVLVCVGEALPVLPT